MGHRLKRTEINCRDLSLWREKRKGDAFARYVREVRGTKCEGNFSNRECCLRSEKPKGRRKSEAYGEGGLAAKEAGGG